MIEVKYRGDFIDALSETIKDFRKNELKLSRREFAKATGFSEFVIANIENGNKCFRRELLVKLTAPFNVEVDYLLKDFKDEDIKKFLKPDTKKVSGSGLSSLADYNMSDFDANPNKAVPISLDKARTTIGNMVSMDQIDFIQNELLIPYINSILEGDLSDAYMDPKFNKAVGERIKQIRTEKGMTQSDVVKAAGWDIETVERKTWISKIEKTVLKRMSLEKLLKISKVLNVTVEYLMYGEEVVQDV